MARIFLKNGVTTGTPTDGVDTLSVGKDATSYIYTVDLKGGNDTANLGPASNAGSNYRIYTGAGNDTVTGGRGIFYDASGDDTYHIRGDALFFAGSGNDTYDGGDNNTGFIDFDSVSYEYVPDNPVLSFVNTQDMVINLGLTTAQNLGIYGSDTLLGIENLFTGNGNDTLRGNAKANQIEGGYGNDLINGLGGNDLLVGEFGADRLYGSSGDDTLRGEGDNDRLYGGAGNDRLIGGFGVDTIYGGAGGDTINLGDGLAARDVVKYTSINDSKLYSTSATAPKVWDVIEIFDGGRLATDDRIDLSAIDTSKAAGNQAFVWRGKQAFSTTAAWEVQIKIIGPNANLSTKSTLVRIDTDSDTRAEMEFVVLGVTDLLKSDFIL